MKHGKLKDGESRMKVVEKSFYGENCCEQFVRFLITNKFYQCYDRKDKNQNGNEGKVKNFIFAHNGMKFDMRFIIDKIFTMLGSPLIIGDVNNLKSCSVKGVNFYDTCLVITQSLDAIAKQFWPNDKSMHKIKVSKEDIEVTREIYEAVKNDSSWQDKMTEYCMQDAHIVREIAQTFFRRIYIEGYKQSYRGVTGYCFPSKMFYYSSASMAWDIWASCFLTDDLTICANKEVAEMERNSYKGGNTIPFKSKLIGGICYDVNSSYPASMCNLMPAHYVDCDNPIKKYNEGDAIINYYLYTASFDFRVDFPAETTHFPSLSVKALQSMVQPLSSNGKSYQLWGIEFKLAIEQGAKIVIESFIPYIPAATHANFIEVFYEKRKQAKQLRDKNKPELGCIDPVMELFDKILMNSQYGKHGQRDFDVIELGDMHSSEERMLELATIPRINNVRRTVYPSETMNLWTVSYHCEGQEFAHKGATVRFASYITAISRVNLMRAILQIQKVSGLESIVYCDTDSIFVDFFAENMQLLQEMTHKRVEMPEDQFCLWMKSQLDSSPIARAISKIMVKDIRKLDDAVTENDTMIPLVDENILGAFKPEKYGFDSFILGAKNYLLNTIGKYEICVTPKMKGVSKEGRDPLQMAKIYDNWVSQNAAPIALFQSGTVFRTTGGCVNISKSVKLIMPTFLKRLALVDPVTKHTMTVPFESVLAYEEHHKKFCLQQKEYVEQYMKENQQIMYELKNGEDNLASRALTAQMNFLKQGTLYDEINMIERSSTLNKLGQILFDDVHAHLVKVIDLWQNYEQDRLTLICASHMKEEARLRMFLSGYHENCRDFNGIFQKQQITVIVTAFCAVLQSCFVAKISKISSPPLFQLANDINHCRKQITDGDDSAKRKNMIEIIDRALAFAAIEVVKPQQPGEDIPQYIQRTKKPQRFDNYLKDVFSPITQKLVSSFDTCRKETTLSRQSSFGAAKIKLLQLNSDVAKCLDVIKLIPKNELLQQVESLNGKTYFKKGHTEKNIIQVLRLRTDNPKLFFSLSSEASFTRQSEPVKKLVSAITAYLWTDGVSFDWLAGKCACDDDQIAVQQNNVVSYNPYLTSQLLQQMNVADSELKNKFYRHAAGEWEIQSEAGSVPSCMRYVDKHSTLTYQNLRCLDTTAGQQQDNQNAEESNMGSDSFLSGDSVHRLSEVGSDVKSLVDAYIGKRQREESSLERDEWLQKRIKLTD